MNLELKKKNISQQSKYVHKIKFIFFLSQTWILIAHKETFLCTLKVMNLQISSKINISVDWWPGCKSACSVLFWEEWYICMYTSWTVITCAQKPPLTMTLALPEASADNNGFRMVQFGVTNGSKMLKATLL